MSESGHTWRKVFMALPVEADRVRSWTAGHVAHEDAPLVANELFVAVLGNRPESIEMTISTAGPRMRITATGQAPLPILQVHGPGALVIKGLSRSSGITTCVCGLWAQLTAPEATHE
ncbi:hypothetical protein [Streptomyces sp. H27-C3]|uniref:hypothetical protein n=1 Tax=Streptomyces sp. H27-C3 TaxID=3046305 RepID=UPI0024B8CF6B|nr:hypothetical protein [Streptomyces sp. H27-C3]